MILDGPISPFVKKIKFFVKKTQEHSNFSYWPPKPIHSVAIHKRKKMYWFWWSTDHFFFPLSFFYGNLDFFTHGEIGLSKIINGAIISQESDLWLV